MVTEVEMTAWIRLVQGSEKVKDQDVDEAHGKDEVHGSSTQINSAWPSSVGIWVGAMSNSQ